MPHHKITNWTIPFQYIIDVFCTLTGCLPISIVMLIYKFEEERIVDYTNYNIQFLIIYDHKILNWSIHYQCILGVFCTFTYIRGAYLLQQSIVTLMYKIRKGRINQVKHLPFIKKFGLSWIRWPETAKYSKFYIT